jgi:hypothetical protein
MTAHPFPPAFPPADDFDWGDPELVAIPSQPSVAVFRNHWGDIVIRQEGINMDGSDMWVRVRPENLPALIRVLAAEIDPAEAPAPQVEPEPEPRPKREAASATSNNAEPMPKDRTAASRAKRYRERKRHADRHADRDATVTQRDAANRDDLTEEERCQQMELA